MNFIKCPFCAGHEIVSDEAADLIAHFILDYLTVTVDPPPLGVVAELENIRNAILNRQERAEPVDTYTPPMCPTPQKRRYSNKSHTLRDATKWHMHPYLCACSYWHLSKQSGNEHETKINAPAASADEFEEIPIDPLML